MALNKYGGQVHFGALDGQGFENSTWGINPATGKYEPVIRSSDLRDFYLLSDLVNEHGSLDAAKNYQVNTGDATEWAAGGMQNPYAFGTWNSRPSNDTFSGKDGLADLLTIATMASPVVAGAAGLFGGPSGGAASAVGDATIAGGAGTDAMVGGASLGGGGSGITAGTTATGIGGGAGGTGLTIGAGGASGISGAAASGALAPSFFAAESLYPVIGGATAAGAGAATGAAAGGAAAGGLGGLLSNPGLIGAGLGALAGGLGGSSQAGTSTTVQDIPEWLKPYAQNMLGQATNTFNQIPKTSPVMGAAQNEYLKTIQGDYLRPESNPYLQDTFNLGANKIKASISPTFGHMQAFGQNSGYNQAAGRSIGEFATGLYGNNYNAERNRQFQATQQAPTFTTGGYEAAFAPFSQYKNLLGGFGSQTSSPYYENKTANLLGGAIAGAGLGRMFS